MKSELGRGPWGINPAMISPVILLSSTLVGLGYVAVSLHHDALELAESLPAHEARRDEARALLDQEREGLAAAEAVAAEAESLRARCEEATP